MNVIEFNNVWKKFKKGEKINSLRDALPNLFRRAFSNSNGLKREEFWALQDINISVRKGEVLGVIGANGAGKSTVLKLLAGILKPNKGEVKISGRLSALIEVTAGFHPELTGRENIYLNGTIIGMTKKEIDSKFNDIVEFSGIGEFIDTPVKRYSSGMYSRLGFSVAAHTDPEILLVDEVLSVGDIAFQAKCAQKMRALMNSGTTIVLVSHNRSLIRSLCQRVVLLAKGKMEKEGNPKEVIPYYENIVYKQSKEEAEKKITTRDEYKVKVNEKPLIKVLNVSIFDGDYRQRDSFGVNEEISLRINFEARQRIENPIFFIDVVRSDGVVCCSSNTKDDNFITGAVEGIGQLKVNLGNLNLAPGVYFMKFSVFDMEMIHPYIMRKKDMFRIISEKANISLHAVFLPKVAWHFSKDNQAELNRD